jgi:porin
MTAAFAAEDSRGQSETPVRALSFGAAYTGDVFSNLSGGRRNGTFYLHAIDLTATAGTERLGGWRGGTLFLDGLNVRGSSPTRLVGDAQGVSNIEAENAWLLYEAWYEQVLFEGHVSVLGGLYGLDSEFDVIETASLLINSSHGTGPDLAQSGKNGPSIFPFTSPGLRLRLASGFPFSLQLAVLDGVPGRPDEPSGVHIDFGPDDGLLIVTEAAYLFQRDAEPAGRRRELRSRHVSRTSSVPFRARVAAGAWTYTGTFDDLAAVDGSGDTLPRTGSRGLYALTEGQVFQEPGDPAQGLALYARTGVASERVNRFGAYAGAGAVYTGPFAGRDEDQVGLGVAAAFNGASYKRARRRSGEAVDGAEVNLELTYLAPVVPWLALQGDVQYVVDPDTDPDLANAVVIAVRLLISL